MTTVTTTEEKWITSGCAVGFWDDNILPPLFYFPLFYFPLSTTIVRWRVVLTNESVLVTGRNNDYPHDIICNVKYKLDKANLIYQTFTYQDDNQYGKWQWTLDFKLPNISNQNVQLSMINDLAYFFCFGFFLFFVY